MMGSILQSVTTFFYWVGVIICGILAYTLPAWGLTRYEREQLRIAQEKLEVSKTEFAKQMQAKETFNQAREYLNSAYQKQTKAIEAYKEALTAINKAEEMRQKSDLK